jgi:hypothetical protein
VFVAQPIAPLANLDSEFGFGRNCANAGFAWPCFGPTTQNLSHDVEKNILPPTSLPERYGLRRIEISLWKPGFLNTGGKRRNFWVVNHNKDMSLTQGTGRRGGQVNFSTFIQDLNVEVPSQNTSPVSEDWEKDIAMFTNTNFFDWEKASGPAPPAEFSGPVQDREVKPTTTAVSREPTASASAVGDFDFSLPG